MRVKVTLACTECKQRNYDTMKNKKNNPDRLEEKKYCKFCKKHTLHKESKDKKNTKKSDKKKKPNIFVRMLDFVKGVFSELKKVNWLTKEELAKSSGFVAGFVAIFTFLIWIIDSGLGALAALLIGLK